MLVFLSLLFVWFALARNMEPAVIGIGIASAAGATFVQHLLFPRIHLPTVPLLIMRLPQLAAFAFVLLLRFVASTVYTSFLILYRRAEGRIVALPVQIEDQFGRFVLLNSITLTPSTISLLLEGNTIYVHWLRAAGHKGDWQTIKESLEQRLIAIFPKKVDNEHR